MRGQWQFDDLLTDSGALRMRKARPRDQGFLLQLFRSSRPHLSQVPMPAEFASALVQVDRPGIFSTGSKATQSGR